MSEVIFKHSKVKEGKPLITSTGFNGISWAYTLNTAQFHTYGGEVVQILSCYIDSMRVEGDVKTYEEAEEVYEFFARYFTIATQGSDSEAGPDSLRFEQEPMTLLYPEREWNFFIQPMAAPGFTYSNQMVTPKWSMQAHIVDRGINNEQLKKFVNEFAQKELAKLGSEFTLTGELSPVAGDIAHNPFIAPMVPKVSDKKNAKGEVTFEPLKAEELAAGVNREVEFYHSLIPSYLKGDFIDVTAVSASSPIFGQPAETGGKAERESEQKKSEQITHGKTG